MQIQLKPTNLVLCGIFVSVTSLLGCAEQPPTVNANPSTTTLAEQPPAQSIAKASQKVEPKKDTNNLAAETSFKVCADPLNPPYSDKNGKGFENKIAELFAKQLGQKLEYTWFPQRIGFINNTLKAEVDNQEGVYKCDVVMGVPAGFDLAATTQPYYHSTYVLLIAKGRGWDDITDTTQLANLPLARQEALRIAMFDRGPGTTWLQYVGLLGQGIPYQTMSGDSENNTAMQIDKDIKAKKIDMVILWGPLAGHVLAQSPKNTYTQLLMPSGLPEMKFDFSMSMGVRMGDKARKAQLNELIEKNRAEIQAILSKYQMPLLPIPAPKAD